MILKDDKLTQNIQKKDNESVQEETIAFPEPDPIISKKPSIRKYLSYLSFFGPGAVVVSMSIGQGQLIIGPQMGAWAGFSFLWLITLNLGSYIFAYIGCRFTMLSGISVMDLFSIKTRNGWINWLFFGIMAVFIPLFTATIVTTLGQVLRWIIGFGHPLIWGISFALFASILVLIGRYRLLEYTQAFFVTVLGIGAVIAMFFIRPDFLEIIPNFFNFGNVPEFPSWVISEFPSVAGTPVSLLMLGYVGTLTISLVPLVGYMGWIRVKKWGIFKDKSDPKNFSDKCFESFKKNKSISYLSNDPIELKKSRLLLTPIRVDLAIAFIIVSIISASYMISGKYLLGLQSDGSYLLPSNIDLITQQAVIFTSLSVWLEPLFKISVLFALFGTVYAGFEAASRMLYETGKGMSKKIENTPYKKFSTVLLIFILLAGLPLAVLMNFGLSVLLILSITLLFIGVIGVIFYGIGVIYMSQTILPEKYRLGKFGLLMGIIGVILLLIPFLFLF